MFIGIFRGYKKQNSRFMHIKFFLCNRAYLENIEGKIDIFCSEDFFVFIGIFGGHKK